MTARHDAAGTCSAAADLRPTPGDRVGDGTAQPSGEASAVLTRIAQAAAAYVEGGETVVVELGPLSSEDRAFVLDVLKIGDCRAKVASEEALDIVESGYLGIWRISAQGGPDEPHDRVEIGVLPRLLFERLAEQRRSAADPNAFPPTTPNSMAGATIHEITEAVGNLRTGVTHAVDLGQVPYTPDDEEELIDWMGTGPVSFVTGGSFPSEVTLTRFYPVWFGKVFGRSGKLSMAVVEISETPPLIAVPAEDIRDAGRQLSLDLADFI